MAGGIADTAGLSTAFSVLALGRSGQAPLPGVEGYARDPNPIAAAQVLSAVPV